MIYLMAALKRLIIYMKKTNMGLASLLLLGVCAMSTQAYLPPMKEHFLPEALLREVMELEGYLEDPSYPQVRSGDYQENPTVRDHEYLQHSSLWANPFISENNENKNLPGIQRPENKQDTLPAYCDPPNPCPIGYTAVEEGCLEEFENTASFSREYQARQDCMCDSEHMFDCAANNRNNDEITEADFDRLVEHLHNVNPYLEGERLPVAAKKGIHIGN